MKRAKGCRILDADDRWLIDYVGTWGPAILGHAPEVLVRTVQEVAKDGLSFGIPNPWEVEMARLIRAKKLSAREALAAHLPRVS